VSQMLTGAELRWLQMIVQKLSARSLSVRLHQRINDNYK